MSNIAQTVFDQGIPLKPELASENFSTLTNIDPFPFYDRMRERAPLVWDELANGWLVTGYEACKHIELNEERFRNPYFNSTPEMLEIKGGRRNVTVLQGDEHRPMHRFMLGLFAPRHVKIYRDLHIRPIIDDLIGGFINTGKTELTSTFSDKLPPRLILSLLNMPWRDDALVQRVLDLHNAIMAWASGQNRDATTRPAAAASLQLNVLLMPYIRERRSNPGEDLISKVWVEGPAALGDITEADAQAICREMFLAGSDTTVHALANAFHILLTQPEVMAAVRADRGKALTALIEESLRLYGAVQYRLRIANQDCEIEGVKIAKDQTLVLINSAANRDPARFACPNAVDLGRTRPHEHLAFNTGPRSCIGSALARAEMADAIEAVLDQTVNLRLDPAAPAPYFAGHFTRSFRPLHILFDPA